MLVTTGQVPVWQFVTLAVLDGLCAAFIGPLQDTAIRGIVPPGQLHSAYAQEEARTHAAVLGGAAALVVLGGLLGLTAAVAALSPALRRFTGEASPAGDDAAPAGDESPRA
ncbi:hypothetical protein [Nonomuraea sp. NPDC050643]|uniref:hypothetical protein n=1 Tax=Nonomuraea sp. NPDC050643 TaxID=3155660 RepID=UPI00340A4F0C